MTRNGAACQLDFHDLVQPASHALHAFPPQGIALARIAYTVPMGIVFAQLRERSGSVWPALLLYVATNRPALSTGTDERVRPQGVHTPSGSAQPVIGPRQAGWVLSVHLVATAVSQIIWT